MLAYILEHRAQKLSVHHCSNCFIRESGGIAEGGIVGGVLSLKEIVTGLECVCVCVCVCVCACVCVCVPLRFICHDIA